MATSSPSIPGSTSIAGRVPRNLMGGELLTVEQMYAADKAAMDGGVSGETLMEAAGQAVADAIRNRWSPCPVAVLCGPGNNGGDGFVVARLLAAAGWTVKLALLGDIDGFKGDAALMAGRWNGAVEALDLAVLDGAELVIDALFGAGLTRPVTGPAQAVVETIAARRLDCVAIDVPSGVHGDSGQALGVAAQARLTVTFFRRKPGHLLLPGRALCGETVVAEIGISETVLEAIAPTQFANQPALWRDHFPWPTSDGHKYSRGHAVVVGGGFDATGAARLAARAALRTGAGLVTVASPSGALMVYASALEAVMVRAVADDEAFAALISDPRKNAVLVGPGNGVTETTKSRTLAALGAGKACVLDADALTVFQDNPDEMLSALSPDTILTPHDGEFARLFDVEGDKLARTRAAAVQAGCVVLLKGGDTVVAAPDGRAAINHNAPPDLATAGAGDVLGGMVLGLRAQGMNGFDAACAAAWLHGDAAARFGPGVIAEDLCETLPASLAALKACN